MAENQASEQDVVQEVEQSFTQENGEAIESRERAVDRGAPDAEMTQGVAAGSEPGVNAPAIAEGSPVPPERAGAVNGDRTTGGDGPVPAAGKAAEELSSEDAQVETTDAAVEAPPQAVRTGVAVGLRLGLP